jgi:hypothetical protein
MADRLNDTSIEIHSKYGSVTIAVDPGECPTACVPGVI